MKLNQIEKVTKIYDKIKALDAEIIRIEKLAQKVVGQDCEIDFGISCVEERQEPAKPLLDADGSLMPHTLRMDMSALWGFMPGSYKPTPAPSEKLKISDTTALRILGLILSDKVAQRERLINKLGYFNIEM